MKPEEHKLFTAFTKDIKERACRNLFSHSAAWEEMFPSIQSKLSLVQLKAITSHPITVMWEEANSHLATTSLPGVVEQ